MAIDASIYGAIRAPQLPNQLEQFAQVQQIQGAQNQNRLADLMYSEKQRESAGDNELARLLASGKGPQEVATGLAGAGYGRQSMAYTKAQQESDKAKGEISKNEAATKKAMLEAANLALTQQRDMLNTVNDPAAAKAWITAAYQNPETQAIFERMGPLDVALQRFDQGITSPEAFAKWKQQASLNAQELVKYTTPDANAKLSADTSRANNAASNATTQRGQNMADARSRESTAAAMTKPFEITGEDGKPILVQQDKQGNILPVQGYLPKQGASKPLTEGQSKALLFGARMQETGDIIEKLALEGVNKSIPGSRAGYGVGATINALQPQDRQRLDQAKRDFVNAVLRRESGAVISDAEFANAEQQYFPQPGEGAEAIAQKKRAREVATRGILAEVPDSDNRVKAVRSSGSTEGKPAAIKDKAAFDALPSGATFIAPDGTTRRKP